MTANTLSVLGGKLALGRNLELTDTHPGAPPVALLAHRVWESRYNKNESVIGKTVRIDGAPYNIIGVTAPGVRLAQNIDLWLPYITPQTPSRGNRELGVFGRLADGVSISQANAKTGAVARQLEVEFPATNKGIGAMVRDFNGAFIRVQFRRVLQVLLGGVAFVLLIACANVANLLLGRAVIRSRENTENALTMAFDLPPAKYKEPQQQVSFFQELIARLESLEMAIRAAMGASGSRLWRLMFFQGMRRFAIGLVIGLPLSFALGRALRSVLVGVSPSDPVSSLVVVSVLTIVAALACGLPARRAARSDPATLLRFE